MAGSLLLKLDGTKPASVGAGMSISGRHTCTYGVHLSVIEALYADERDKDNTYECYFDYSDRTLGSEMKKIDDMTTVDVFANIIQPLVGDANMSYCTYLQHNDADSDDKVGLATVFVKNAWKYKYKDLIPCLEHNFQKAAEILKSLPEAYRNTSEQNKKTFVWIDVFSCSSFDLEIDLAISHRNMGLSCHDKDSYDEALSHFQSAMFIIKNAIFTVDTNVIKESDLQMQVVSLYGHMGDSCHGKGEQRHDLNNNDYFLQAVSFYQHSLESAGRFIEKDHLFIADTYYKIGNVNFDMRRWEEALSYYQRSLDINMKKDSKSTQVGDINHKMGNVTHKLKEWDTAVSHFRLSLEIYIKNLGDSHTNVAETYFHLATVYKEKAGVKGYSPDAVENYTHAMKIYMGEESGWKGKHSRVADIWFHLGDMARKKGKHDEAMTNYRMSEKVYGEQLGQKHIFIANVNQAMAHCCAERGDYPAAITCYKKAESVYSEKLGPRHLEIAQVYHHMALAYYEDKAYPDAMRYCELSLELFKENRKERCVPVAAVHIVLADHARHQKKDCKQAVKHYKYALEIYLANGMKVSQQVAEVYHKMADATSALKQHDQGIGYYFCALEGYKAVLGERHSCLAGIHFNMGVMYYEKAQADGTGELFEEAYDRFCTALSIFTLDGTQKLDHCFTEQIKQSQERCLEDISVREGMKGSKK